MHASGNLRSANPGLAADSLAAAEALPVVRQGERRNFPHESLAEAVRRQCQSIKLFSAGISRAEGGTGRVMYHCYDKRLS